MPRGYFIARPVIRYAYLLATLVFVGLVATKFERHTGFTSLIRFGSSWEGKRSALLNGLPIATIERSNGYDGQFYAQVAIDPLLRGGDLKIALDSPVYRARRILAPATAAVLGLGYPWWTLQVFALLNVACWFVLSYLLTEFTGPSGWFGFARWFGCMFSLGILDSVRQSLVDLPALLLVVLAVRSSLRSRSSGSTLWFALANLAKETSGIATFALCDYNPAHWKRTLSSLILSLLPLALWAIYVEQRFGSASATSNPQQNFAWPFVAMFSQILLSMGEISRGNSDSRYWFSLLAVAGFVVQGAVICKTRAWTSPWWKLGAAYSVLFLILGPWVWSGYWAVCRAVLPLTFAFNLLLPANRVFWPLWIIGNVTLAHGLWRFI